MLRQTLQFPLFSYVLWDRKEKHGLFVLFDLAYSLENNIQSYIVLITQY
jgi:hypothetical protein